MKLENIIAYGSYILVSIVSIVFNVLSHGMIDVMDQMIFLMITVIYISCIRELVRRDKWVRQLYAIFVGGLMMIATLLVLLCLDLNAMAIGCFTEENILNWPTLIFAVVV